MLVPFDQSVGTAWCQVFCRNMDEHLGGVSFEHMEVEDRLLLIICAWELHRWF